MLSDILLWLVITYTSSKIIHLMNYENWRYDTVRWGEKINPKQATKPICKRGQERCFPIISSMHMHICPFTTIVTITNTLIWWIPSNVIAQHLGCIFPWKDKWKAFPCLKLPWPEWLAYLNVLLVYCYALWWPSVPCIHLQDLMAWGHGTRICFGPTCALFSYIMVNFKAPPNFVCSGHIKWQISRPFMSHMLLFCDLSIWWTPTSQFACLGLSCIQSHPDTYNVTIFYDSK